MREASEQTKSRPWWVTLLWTVAPILVVLSVAFLYDANGRAKLNRAIAEARQAGDPVTFAQIDAARRRWADDENGAAIILSLMARLAAIPKEQGVKQLPFVGDADPPPLGQRWGDELDRAAGSQLQRLSPELATIDRLAQYAGGRFPIAFPPPPAAILPPQPHLPAIRESLRLKTLHTVHQAMSGQTSRLVDDVTVMVRHGQLLADEPYLTSALVHVACDALVVSAIEHVCALATLNPQQLTQIEQLLATMESDGKLYWGLLTERAIFINLSGVMGLGRGITRFPGLRGWHMQDQAAGVRMVSRLIRASQDPDQAMKVISEIEKELDTSYSRVFTNTALPALIRSVQLDLRTTAVIRSARAALACERYRLDKGLLPEQLDQLVPDYLDGVPIDPFDGQPLRYRVDDDAVIVYSIGEDVTDDGGEVNHRTDQSPAPDWGFVLLSPEFRSRPPPPDQAAVATAPTTRDAPSTRDAPTTKDAPGLPR